jgi:glycosyltransferase involved in cell wall biosynthesis
MELVSVIIPVYNVRPYLERCVSALRNQTYKELEILLVDDGSTDGSRELLGQLEKQDPRIRVLLQPENRGVSAARNRALTAANGQWVCFCDGDDWFELTFVEKLLTCAHLENADYVFCNYQIVSDGKPPIPSGSITGMKSSSDRREIIACGPTASCTHLISMELFRSHNISYPVGCKQYEELPVIPVLAKYARRIGVVDEPLYNYYQRGNGSSASNTAEDRTNVFLTSWNCMRKALGEGYEQELVYHAAYALLYGETMKACKSGKNSRQIRELINKCEEFCPDYLRNPYIQRLSRMKLMYLIMVKYRLIPGLRLLSWIHSILVH